MASLGLLLLFALISHAIYADLFDLPAQCVGRSHCAATGDSLTKLATLCRREEGEVATLVA